MSRSGDRVERPLESTPDVAGTGGSLGVRPGASGRGRGEEAAGTFGAGDGTSREHGSLAARMGFEEPIVELGATHPALRRALLTTGSTLGFLVTLDDDRILDLEVEIGLGHRGFEKQVESGPWLRALPYVARLGYAGAPIAEIAYCLGVEALAGLTIPERAVWTRTLVSELARVADHFSRLTALTAAIELPAAEHAAWDGAAATGRLLERVTGGGPFVGTSRPGGVTRPLPEPFAGVWAEERRTIEGQLARFESLGARNPSMLRRLRDVAPLGVEAGLAWSVTGPALRAAGLPMDLRRDAPYLAYGELDFDVAVGERGDGEDRLRVVVEEIRQGLRMVEQCRVWLEGAGPGPICVTDPEWAWPVPPGSLPDAAERTPSRKPRGKGRKPPGAKPVAALDDVLAEGPRIPAGEVEVSVEGSTGELGFLLISDGEGLPRRIRCRAPSFFHAQVLPEMLRGARLDDVLPTAASMHIVSGECDR